MTPTRPLLRIAEIISNNRRDHDKNGVIKTCRPIITPTRPLLRRLRVSRRCMPTERAMIRQLHLGCISAASRLHLGCISRLERLDLEAARVEQTHLLQATSYKLQVTSHTLQATSYKLQATGYKLQATSHKPQATSDRHAPFRDSKLTFLLRDSLGGNAQTALIAAVAPGEMQPRCSRDAAEM